MYENHLTRGSVTIQKSNQHKVKIEIESSCRCQCFNLIVKEHERHKRTPKNHLVLSLLLLSIAWLIKLLFFLSLKGIYL